MAAQGAIAQQRQDPTTGMFAAPTSSAIQMVSASKLLADSNVGFLTAEGKPRSAAELAYNQRSGVFSEIIDAVGGKDAAMTNFVRHTVSDPNDSSEETVGLGSLGEVAANTLALDVQALCLRQNSPLPFANRL